MTTLTNIFHKDGFTNHKLIQENLNIYFFSTGINVSAIDEKGNVIASSGECPVFCEFFKEQKSGFQCSHEHLKASLFAERLGQEYIFLCSSGLVHYTAPIIHNKVFKGALIGGPVLLDYPDDIIIDDIVNKNKFPLNTKGKLLSYFKEIPVIEPSRVRYLSKMLFLVAANLMTEDMYILYERNEKTNQQSKIGEAIQHIKESNSIDNFYPYEKEKELLSKVKNGDVIGAKSILNDILGCIFFNAGGDIEIIKARTLELCTLLSRAAVEGGAALDKIFGMNYKFIGELSKINNLENLSYWTLKVLDRFGENVFKLPDSKNVEIIKRALYYINENYMNNITLESTASYVHLNSSYFSTIFKKEVGMGFSDYLNKVRIEASKQFLKNINNSILDVALAVGFEDQSYYSKVFKKITKMTPKQFKDRQI